MHHSLISLSRYLIQKNSLAPSHERVNSKKSKSHLLTNENRYTDSKKNAAHPSFANYTNPTTTATEEDKKPKSKKDTAV
jgi:hypothetical protein